MFVRRIETNDVQVVFYNKKRRAIGGLNCLLSTIGKFQKLYSRFPQSVTIRPRQQKFMEQLMSNTTEEYIPALSYRFLTPFFDFIQKYIVRDTRYKSLLIQQANIVLQVK